jgi:hypothetical protein
MKLKLFTLLSLLIFAIGCPMTPTNIVIQAEDDVSMKASWNAYMASRPNAKIVLRVPGYTKEITQAEMSQYESFYNFVEKRLLQAQFTVRDRSLLNEVLTRAGSNLSYMEIRNKVDTDIMLEFVSYKVGPISAMQTTEGAGTPPTPTTIPGAVLEGRVIMVETGEVVGMFTLKEIHPYPEAAGLATQTPEQLAIAVQAMTPEQQKAMLSNIQIGSEQMWNALAKKLVDVLKGNPISPSRIVRTTYSNTANNW